MSEVESYCLHMHRYRRNLATGNNADALTCLDAAIEVCPIDEALPQLTEFRRALETAVQQPAPWWQKVLGVKA